MSSFEATCSRVDAAKSSEQLDRLAPENYQIVRR